MVLGSPTNSLFHPTAAMMSKRSIYSAGLVMFIWIVSSLSPSNSLWAQSKEASPSEREAQKQLEAVDQEIYRQQRRAQSGIRQLFRGTSSQNQLANLSFRNFIRGGLGTGNLIQVPYVTNVNISAGYWGSYVSPNKITWPKGSGVEYGHTMSFMVGGKVNADDGNQYVIISDSYNRSGGDSSPDGSHKYHFTPVPGYYNMTGDPESSNKLNNNSTDRALLEAAGYDYVGGLNEDTNQNGVLDPGEDLNNNGVLDTELTNNIEFAAQSNLPETWPSYWPVGSYPGDMREEGEAVPGTRAGLWNGAYGAYLRGDQESYYVADDRDNDEFPYYPFLDPSTGEPDTRNWAQGGRRGMGIEISTRQYQWSSVLAEDIFISTFDVENVSRKDIPEIIIAMIVDYDIGGSTGSNEALFDTRDDITYQWHKNNIVRNGYKVGYGGVGFLESPGISDDGIDNDQDGMVDESREDGIDNDGDWTPWIDSNGDGIFNNEDANHNCALDLGEDLNGDGKLTIETLNDDTGSDGLGPCDEGYRGPDANGTEANGVPDLGEPNYEFTDNDEIDQIGLTNMVIRTPSDFDRDLDDDELFWNDYIQPVPESEFIIPTETADIIYNYASGIVSLNQSSTQRFSIAFFAGNNFDDMLRNKRTMQNIYNADYSFAKPPRTPLLTAVPGDGKVTLVWDESAEFSRDPIYGLDFEMYKVYRSTDPEFNDIKTITDAFGNPLLWTPIAQFDKANGLTGAHPVPIGSFGISYDMGTDSGLKYELVDEDVQNGRTYYYAVASVDQGYHSSFFEEGISEFENLVDITPTESSKIIEVDAFDRPVNVDRNAAVVVPQAPAAGYVSPQIEGESVTQVKGVSTANVRVEFLVPDEANKQGYTYELTFTDDNRYAELDSMFFDGGVTTGFTLKNSTTGATLLNVQGGASTMFTSQEVIARLYDGMRLNIENPASPSFKEARWLRNNLTGVSPTLQAAGDASGQSNVAVPRDYEIRVSQLGASKSYSINKSQRKETNFQVWDVTDINNPFQVPYSYTDRQGLIPTDTESGMLSPGDQITPVFGTVPVPFLNDTLYSGSTYRFTFSTPQNAQAQLESLLNEANDWYSALRLAQIRGYNTIPYGSDISMAELLPFLEEIEAFIDQEIGSINQTTEAAAIIQGLQSPSELRQNAQQGSDELMPKEGDDLFIEANKPLASSDVYRFKVIGNDMQNQVDASVLDSIFVAPDPYIVVNPLESRNTSLPGRGEKRIDFRNLPQECTIRIYTISGRHVKTIQHQGSNSQSIASWNLHTEDDLEISYGVYIYHVEAPGIGEKIGRFAVIK